VEPEPKEGQVKSTNQRDRNSSKKGPKKVPKTFGNSKKHNETRTPLKNGKEVFKGFLARYARLGAIAEAG
jgi:hypothetical protein